MQKIHYLHVYANGGQESVRPHMYALVHLYPLNVNFVQFCFCVDSMYEV